MLVGTAGLKPYLPYSAESGNLHSTSKATSKAGCPSCKSQVCGDPWGSTSAAVDRFSSTSHNAYTGKAFAQVGLRAEQTRIAFRTAAAGSKGESVNTYSFGDKSPPSKDGNVMVTLAESLAGGTGFFTVREPETKKPGGLLGGLVDGLVGGFESGADLQFIFTASISYRAETVGMMKMAQRDMLGLVKQ